MVLLRYKTSENAADALNTNILFLKSGGDIILPRGYISLTPLSAKYLDNWYEINERGIALLTNT